MKILLVALCALTLTACCGEPVVQLRSPLSFGMGPATVPGPSSVLVPQTYTPTYAPAAAAGCSCFGMQYAPPPAPAAQAPCP